MAKPTPPRPVIVAINALKVVIVTFLNPKTLVGLTTFVIVVRMPGPQLLELAKVMFDDEEKGKGLSTVGWVAASAGWILAFAFLISGGIIIRLMRRTYLNEIDRLAKERNLLQEKLTDQPIQTSHRKRN